MRRAPGLRLSRTERRELGVLARRTDVAARVAARAQIVLLAADGVENRRIAEALRTSPGTVALWRRRYLAEGRRGIERDAPRPGRPPTIPTSTIQLVVRTTEARPPAGSVRWTSRRLARSLGVSKSTVQRIWKRHGIRPEGRAGRRTIALRAGFGERVTDLVGLLLDPPGRAMAFAVDESGGTNPTTPSPSVPDRLRSRQVQGFRSFLQSVDREVPGPLEVHLLVDSREPASSPEVRRWLVRHPRFIVHLLPPTGGPPNLIDRLLRGIVQHRARAGASESAARLRGSLRRYFATAGGPAGPLVWTAAAEEIR